MKQKNKYKRWTEQQDRIIKRNFKKLKYIQLARKLGRSEMSIRSRTSIILGLIKKEEWSKKEENIIIRMVTNGNNYCEISKVLNRSVDAIRQHALIMGIKRNQKWMTKTKAERLKKEYKQHSNFQLSLRLGVPIYIIKTNLHHFGLRRDGLKVKNVKA